MSAQGQSGPQVQLGPQVVVVIVVLAFGAGGPAWFLVAFIPADARLPEPLHPKTSALGELVLGANGSAYRAMRRGPASTGSNPTSRISVAATSLASASLGTVPKAQATLLRHTFRASRSAPEEVRPRMSPLSSSFIGSEQLKHFTRQVGSGARMPGE